MTKIKLCGMMSPADIKAANSLQPDYIGFVFAKRSPRAVMRDVAAEMKKMLDPAIRAVGVFVDEPFEVVENLLRDGVIDLAQLHGSEDPSYIRRLQEETGKPVIRAFRVRGAADLKAAAACPADLILLDAGAGSGKTFDWSLLQDYAGSYLLAGGLDPDNVQTAIRAVHPWGVDVSSGIETDGHKDPEKMAAFVNHVRAVSDGTIFSS